MRISCSLQPGLSLLLAGVLAMPPAAAGDGINPPSSGSLRLLVREGDNAVNNFRRRVVSPVVVELRDERNRPVPNARVRFTLPAIGPGGRFADGSRTAETFTDATGRASITGFVPNEQEGRFSMVIEAVSNGREANAVVSQTNYRFVMPAPSARAFDVAAPPRRSSKALFFVLGIGAAAAAGGMVAIRGGGRSTAAAGTGPVGVSVGGVTVGGPQ